MLHLARAIVRSVALGITGARSHVRSVRIDHCKLLHEDWVLRGTVEEDDEHHGGEADCEGQLVFVHGGWGEPIKDALPCKPSHRNHPSQHWLMQSFDCAWYLLQVMLMADAHIDCHADLLAKSNLNVAILDRFLS